MQIAEDVGVKRFVQISSAAVESIFRDDWYQGPHGDYLNYNTIKYLSDEWLQRQTRLNYTILRPGVLVAKPGTGKVTFDVQHRSYNTITDVAQVAVKILDYPNTIKKMIAMGNGDLTIDQALAAIK
jgi:nucleoside-diphosphate-sugar epimerase